jgi:hypothetical protein
VKENKRRGKVPELYQEKRTFGKYPKAKKKYFD